VVKNSVLQYFRLNLKISAALKHITKLSPNVVITGLIGSKPATHDLLLLTDNVGRHFTVGRQWRAMCCRLKSCSLLYSTLHNNHDKCKCCPGTK